MVELYQSSKSNISEHIKHIFEEGEFDENSVVRKFQTTASDGKNSESTFYNLDLIISLGYRIKSYIATQFRIWATQRLKEYIVQNKLHYDAHGHTAAEIIFERADSNSSGISQLFSYYGSFCFLEKSILSRKGGTAKEKSV